VRRQQARGVARPVIYIQLSNANELLAILAKAGIKRSEIRLWTAHYREDHQAHICGPSEGLNGTADATQYYDRALNKNLDVSLCSDSFFGAPPKPPFVPSDEVNWEREWVRIVAKKGLRYHLRRVFLKAKMVHRERRIVDLARVSSWQTLNRKDRYTKLFNCTKAR
jgi:hypothetical protein